MNPWLDAAVRFGLPLAGLWVVTRALWPLLLRFIDRTEAGMKAAEDRLAAVQTKSDASAAQHYEWAQNIIREFAAALGKYNESNAETARQLKVVADTLAKGEKR